MAVAAEETLVGQFGPLPRATAAGNTAITVPVPPHPGPFGRAPFAYRMLNVNAPGFVASGAGRPNWMGLGRTILTSCLYTTGATAHLVSVWRPLNFTYAAADVGANSTTLLLADDPGAYSTAFRYPTCAGSPPATADNLIATNDTIAVQLLDGTWLFTTVTMSGLTATLATGTPNVTDAGIAKFTPIFFFGLASDIDPNTRAAHPATTVLASGGRVNVFDLDSYGPVEALHPGDPLILHSNNLTDAGSFEGAAGHFVE